MPAPSVMTRDEAICKLRRCLSVLCDEDHTLCQVAAERGIFCRGFRRWDDHEFHLRWKAVLGQSTHLSRPQIELLADLWQLSEQIRCHVGLACDTRTAGGGPCRGWDEFSNESLARFCTELLGGEAVVVAKRSDANASVGGNPFREISRTRE